jgi:hypothetical protein
MDKNQNSSQSIISRVQNTRDDVVNWFDDLKSLDSGLYNKLKPTFNSWNSDTEKLISTLGDTDVSSYSSRSSKNSGSHPTS